jgi:glycerate 2-kinase
MRFLIAPDKFKGSLSAHAVAENIALGIRDVLPEAEIEIAPVADGGEGTAEIISFALGGEWVTCGAHDAPGRVIDARYVWIKKEQRAVIEMSAAAGLARLGLHERDPMRASTFGVGEMIRDAMRRGPREIIVGLGGSATNDGGFGMARSLGFRFFTGDRELVNGAAELTALTRIVPPSPPAFAGGRTSDSARLDARVIAAVDVQNPLLGLRGATRVFGAQKGATAGQVEQLETALTSLANVVARDLGCDHRDEPGAGAAGGLGFGLMSFCGAKLRSGFDVVADAIGLSGKIRLADFVITGEGRLDAQTSEGKAPAGVAMLARKADKPVYAIVGQAAGRTELFDNVFTLAHGSISRARAIELCAPLLRERASELARSLPHS